MLPTLQKQRYTPETYLELETQSEVRHEYRDGEMIEMSGGTPNHNRIALGLGSMVRLGLKRQPYDVFVVDQRLWIPALGRYTYPDVMVVADPIQLQAGRTDTVLNPILIAEVLSKSTREYDKSDKFAAYRTIATLREYLTIDQYVPQIEHYVKVEGGWFLRDYVGLETSFFLEAIAVEIALADLYEKVDFSAGAD